MSTLATIVFFIFACLSVAAAFGVVTSHNIVHSAYFLALAFSGIAILYVLLNAEFLAAAQILVYAGAIAIMVIFAVMLTLRGDVRESNKETDKSKWGALAGVLLFALIAIVILTNGDWRILPPEGTPGGAAELSSLLLQWYMIPFETAAFLITFALIGAIILAKGVSESK